MTTKNCPLCGNDTLETKQGEYRFEPPPNIPGGEIAVVDTCWLACSSCGEAILPDELTKAIEAEQYRRLGLLSPDEIRIIRRRTGLTAVEMAHVLGVGEKSYTRWENGRSIQNKSNDTLIRLLDNNSESFAIVDAERSPGREKLVSAYVADIANVKGQRQHAMAAHGGDLGLVNTENLRSRLKEVVATHEK